MGSLDDLEAWGSANILDLIKIAEFLDGSVAMIKGSAGALGGDT